MQNVFKVFPHWDVIVWIAWWGWFAAWEIMGLLRFHDAVPLTWIIRDTIPKPILAMLIAWLAYHFLIEGK